VAAANTSAPAATPTRTPRPPTSRPPTRTPTPTEPGPGEALGLFEVTFSEDGNFANVLYDQSEADRVACFYHPITFSEREVGQLLNVYYTDVALMRDLEAEAGLIQLVPYIKLYRLTGEPWSGYEDVDYDNDPDVLRIVNLDQEELNWVVDEPGNYAICFEMPYFEYDAYLRDRNAYAGYEVRLLLN
jgi:hypothetical protein